MIVIERCCARVLEGCKRKSSSNSGSDSADGMTPQTVSQKKPRLFFSEDQKTALRQAYIADPYPNQAAIDRLAADIGVGVKTVVNWFHNHRMRAKQQPAAGTEHPAAAAAAAAAAACLALELKTEPDGGGFLDAAEEQQSSSVDSLDDGTQRHSADVHSMAAVSASSASTSIAKTRVKNLSASSRRKRAKPHRLSSGTVRDRTEQHAASTHADDDDSADANSRAAASVELTVDQATSSVTDSWVDEERERNIERLQRNLEQEPAIDWEF